MSEQTETVSVSMEVVYTPSWLSWVAATTTCLRMLEVACDPVDVAGMTGYAFHLLVARGVGVSGPTAFEGGGGGRRSRGAGAGGGAVSDAERASQLPHRSRGV